MLKRSPSVVIAEWAPSGDAVYYFQTEEPDEAGRRALGGFYTRESGSDATQLMDPRSTT